MEFKPHVTVSAVTERDDRFLVVEEEIHGRRVINNPAGHLEDGETLVEAVIRETVEETGCAFEPEAVTGIYLWRKPGRDKTFLRVNFFGHCREHDASRELDDGIIAAHWMTREELAAQPDRLRSPLVLRCIDDYLDGRRYPLDVLTHMLDIPPDD